MRFNIREFEKLQELMNYGIYENFTFIIPDNVCHNTWSISIDENFDTFDCSTWEIDPKCEDVSNLFDGWTDDISGLDNLDFTNVKKMAYIFAGCAKFNQSFYLHGERVNSVENMFLGCHSLNSKIDLDIYNCISMECIFHECISLNVAPDIDTQNIVDADYAFFKCYSLNKPIKYYMPNLITAIGMFSGCVSLNKPVSITMDDKFDSVEISRLFVNCHMYNQPFKYKNCHGVSVFLNCHSLKL